MGLTPLLHAAMNDHLEVVEALLDGGAETETRDVFNSTALMYSVGGDGAVTRALLAGGADIGAEDGNGNTALHHALMVKNYNVAQVLIDAGADVQIENAEGITATEMARQAGTEIINLGSSIAPPREQPPTYVEIAPSKEEPPAYVDYKKECRLAYQKTNGNDGANVVFYINGERYGRGTPTELDLEMVREIHVYQCIDLIKEPTLNGIVVIDTRSADK